MFRLLIAALAVAALAASAAAQPRANTPPPGAPPSRPPAARVAPPNRGAGGPYPAPGRGFASGDGQPDHYGYYPDIPSPYDPGYRIGGTSRADLRLWSPPAALGCVPVAPEPAVALANEFPATLALQFPAAAEVWLNGQAVTGAASEERVLTSPVLKPGERFTFEVKARWRQRGTGYESVRAVTLGPGDRGRLHVVSGTEVRE